MSVQVKRRRDTAANLATFTGAQAELLVDTTNNRVQVHDGVTAGGWPAAKLSEVVTNTRTAVSDAAYTALTTDRLVAYAALTAARVVTLPAASAYPTGTALMIVDETGACSASKTITVNRAGSDTIDGAASFVIDAAYGGLEIESNGSNAWTILSPRPNVAASLVGVGTAPDPNNVLSAYGVSALFNSAGNFNLTINKGGSSGASADTASLIFEDGFSGRAQMGLNGGDNFSFKVSPNGSSWTTAIALDATTGAASFANQRTAISDAAYSALVTDRLIAYTAITAARVVTLPAASAFPPGQPLIVVDESGACSATKTITLSRAGSDTINGATSAIIANAYGFAALESNGSNAWTVIDTAAPSAGALTGATLASNVTASSLTSVGELGSLAVAGNVGVGTTSPTQQFEVYGSAATVLVQSTVDNYGILLVKSGVQGFGIQVNGANNRLDFTNANAGFPSASYLLSILSGGNVGIGTTSPAQKLDVNGAIAISGAPAIGSDRSVYHGSFTVGTLPAAGNAGRTAFASNGRMFNGSGTLEGSGAGTGGLVVDNGTAWKIAGTNQTVQA